MSFHSTKTPPNPSPIAVCLCHRSRKGAWQGIADDGTPVGVVDSDLAQRQIKDRLRDNIRPSCLGLFDVRLVDAANAGAPVVCIDIAHGLEGPYYLRKIGRSPEGCLIRMGSAVESMTEEQIEKVYAKRLRNSLGRIVSPRQGLTFSQLRIYYSGKGIDLNDEYLQNLELLDEDGKFNYAAYLLADSNGNSVKFAKYAGLDRVDLIENEEFGKECLVKSFHELETRLRGENKTFARITPTVREERSMVDPVALREAVLNALLHNDYSYGGTPKIEWFSDRVEIVSCGGLPSGLSREGMLAGRSVPRNKEIMRVFRDLGLVESLGSGVNRILKAYPDTVFDTHDPDFFVVILRFAEAIVKGGPQKGGPKRGGPKKGGPKNEKGGLKTLETVENTGHSEQKGGIKNGGPKNGEGGLKRDGPKAEKGGLKRGGPKKEDYLNQGVHVRIRIAELLANGEATTTAQLIERLGKARSTVFKHLALLRRMNVIRYVGSSKTGHWEVLGSFPKQ